MLLFTTSAEGENGIVIGCSVDKTYLLCAESGQLLQFANLRKKGLRCRNDMPQPASARQNKQHGTEGKNDGSEELTV